jgi:hypothetical protein
MKAGFNSNLMQYGLEKKTKQFSILNTLENEIECPRCHDIMTLCSDFDFSTINVMNVIALYNSPPNLDCYFAEFKLDFTIICLLIIHS